MIPEVHEVELSNGFRAFLVPRRGLPIAASVLYYRVGSRDERSGETGVSHFLEHMMFKGTSRYAKGEIDAITSRLGGSNNAQTDQDSTAYFFALAADRWETALEIEANRMTDCLFDPEEFAAEKSVVLEELAMGQDDPWRSLFEATESLAYRVHPYHNPIIGWREDLERLAPQGMRSYYQRHYGPNRSFLVVAGDIDLDATSRRIESLFGSLPRVAERDAPLTEPPHAGERRGTIRAPGGITRIAMAAPVCRMGERDDFVLDILGHVLGTGRNSRLHRRLILDEEIATHVSIANEPRFDPGMFWILLELRPGADPERAEALVREEVDKVLHDGVTAAELKRSRIQLRSGFLFEGETVLDTAMKIGRFEAAAQGGYRLLDSVLELYDEVDRREVREVAVRWLRPDAWTVMWSLPEGMTGLRPSASARKKTARKQATRKKVTRKKVAAKEAAPAGRTPSKKAKAKPATTNRPAKQRGVPAKKSSRGGKA